MLMLPRPHQPCVVANVPALDGRVRGKERGREEAYAPTKGTEESGRKGTEGKPVSQDTVVKTFFNGVDDPSFSMIVAGDVPRLRPELIFCAVLPSTGCVCSFFTGMGLLWSFPGHPRP